MTTQVNALRWFASADRRRLLSEGAWAGIGQLASAIGTLIGMRLLTEAVTPEVFGTVTLLTGLSIFGSNLLCMPVYQAMQRFFSRAVQEQALGALRMEATQLVRTSVIVLTMGFALVGLSVQWLQAGSWLPFVLLAALVPLEAMRAFEITLFGAARRQRPYGLWNACEAWLRPLCAVALASWFGASASAVLAGYLVGTGIGVLVFRWAVRLEGKPDVDAGAPPALRSSEPLPARYRSEIIGFAWPLVPLAICSWANALGDRYLIGGSLGLESAGIYVAAYGLISRPFLMLGTVVSQTIKPLYYAAVASGEAVRASGLLRRWCLLVLTAGVSGIIAVWIGQNQLGRWLLAEEFRSGTALMPWIATGYALQMFATVLESVHYAHGDTGRLAIGQAVSAGVALLAAWLGAQWGGLTGAAMACPISFAVQSVVLALLIFSTPSHR